jgi:hypothetical protein
LTVLVPVLPEQALQTWPTIIDLVESAIPSAGGRYNSLDFLSGVIKGYYHLWVIYDVRIPIGVIITQIAKYPRQKRLRYLLLAGKDIKSIMTHEPEFDRWAKSVGCAGAEMCGRLGWKRVLKHWKSDHIEMSREY